MLFNLLVGFSLLFFNVQLFFLISHFSFISSFGNVWLLASNFSYTYISCCFDLSLGTFCRPPRVVLLHIVFIGFRCSSTFSLVFHFSSSTFNCSFSFPIFLLSRVLEMCGFLQATSPIHISRVVLICHSAHFADPQGLYCFILFLLVSDALQPSRWFFTSLLQRSIVLSHFPFFFYLEFWKCVASCKQLLLYIYLVLF